MISEGVIITSGNSLLCALEDGNLLLLSDLRTDVFCISLLRRLPYKPSHAEIPLEAISQIPINGYHVELSPRSSNQAKLDRGTYFGICSSGSAN